MKRLIVLFLFVAGIFMVGLPAMADCLATVEQVKPAQDIRAEAVSLRDAGSYDAAAAKFLQAANLHPQEAYQASYLMNYVGCLLCQRYSPAKGYQAGNDKRLIKNSQAGYAGLDMVKAKIDKAEQDGCEYSSGVIQNTKNWYYAQLKYLTSVVDREQTEKE